MATKFDGQHVDIEGPKREKQVVYVSKEGDLVKVDLSDTETINITNLPRSKDPLYKKPTRRQLGNYFLAKIWARLSAMPFPPKTQLQRIDDVIRRLPTEVYVPLSRTFCAKLGLRASRSSLNIARWASIGR